MFWAAKGKEKSICSSAEHEVVWGSEVKLHLHSFLTATPGLGGGHGLDTPHLFI
jgi:hypothetical protein